MTEQTNARYDGAWYYCWLIERRDGPPVEWWGVNGFVTEAHRACWFARREDADKLASEMSVDVFVCEHGFMLDSRAPSQPAEAPSISDERLRNTRAWAAARIGSLSGAEVIVTACDEALAARDAAEAPRVPMPSAFTEEEREALEAGAKQIDMLGTCTDNARERAAIYKSADLLRSLAARNGGGK